MTLFRKGRMPPKRKECRARPKHHYLASPRGLTRSFTLFADEKPRIRQDRRFPAPTFGTDRKRAYPQALSTIANHLIPMD